MSRLPVISGRDLVRALGSVGFQFDRQKGSHMILFRAEPPTALSVPDIGNWIAAPYVPCSTSRFEPRGFAGIAVTD